MKIKLISNPLNASDVIFNIIAQQCEVFKDQNGELYVLCTLGTDTTLVYLSEAHNAKSLFRQLYFTQKNKTVKSGDVSNAYDTVCALAMHNAETVPVFQRIACFDDSIYYDLNNPAKQVVKITANNVSIIGKNTIKDVNFLSPPTLKEQKFPVSTEYSLRAFLADFLGLNEQQSLLVAVYICTAFIPGISHPVLVVEGEKGAGKTTFMKILSLLISPTSKDVFVMPDESDDLITTLSNNYFCIFDNVGKLKADTANVLCQASTGGTLIKRKLYSDNSEIAINIKRLVALNGINLEISQSDLLDRTIIVYLARIDEKKRCPDQELYQRLDACLPGILDDIFSVISKALLLYETVRLGKYPRMADFAKYGYVIAEAIKQGLGDEFIVAYENNISLATESAVGENPLIECVKYLIDNEGSWYGSASDLLLKLKSYLPLVYVGVGIPSSFPKMANSLSRKLSLYKAEFDSLGISVKKGRNKDRYLTIERKKSSSAPTISTIKSPTKFKVS